MTLPVVQGVNNRAPSQETVWLGSLMTPDPQSGYELAIELSRMAVKFTQPSAEIREKLRPLYDRDADALVRIAAVVASNFRTVAAANDYWRPIGQVHGEER